MSVFLSDVLVFVTCQMKMHQLCVEQESLWACQNSFTTYCEEAPCACTEFYTTRNFGWCQSKRFSKLFNYVTSTHILWYAHDIKAFDMSINILKYSWENTSVYWLHLFCHTRIFVYCLRMKPAAAWVQYQKWGCSRNCIVLYRLVTLSLDDLHCLVFTAAQTH